MSDERERALAAWNEGGRAPVAERLAFKDGFDAGQDRAEQLKRELAAERERVVVLQQVEAVAHRELAALTSALAAERAELQSAAQEANDLNRTVERLTQELAAERERNDGYNFMCREAEEVHERGWQWRPIDKNTAFAPPFGTIRQCRVCGCLVAGGPTACARCAKAGA